MSTLEGIDRHGIPEGSMGGGRGPLIAAASSSTSSSPSNKTSFSWGDELTELGERVVRHSGVLPQRPRLRHLLTTPMKSGVYAVPIVGTALASVQAGILLGGIWLTGIGSAIRIAES